LHTLSDFSPGLARPLEGPTTITSGQHSAPVLLSPLADGREGWGEGKIRLLLTFEVTRDVDQDLPKHSIFLEIEKEINIEAFIFLTDKVRSTLIM
jgi:hypothetical protein